jgi:hypothetical protein
LLSPTNGATGRPITNSAVSWSTSAGATSYTVELSTSTSFATPLQSQTGLTATSASFSGLTALTTYYWRVGATNSVGTTWSATWSFTTALAVPTLSLPSNAAINVPLTPTFTWNSTGAATYDIQVATRSNFTSSSIVVNRTAVAGTSFTQTTALRSRTTHYWRVRSRAANGTTSAWSAGRSFTTL